MINERVKGRSDRGEEWRRSRVRKKTERDMEIMGEKIKFLSIGTNWPQRAGTIQSFYFRFCLFLLIHPFKNYVGAIGFTFFSCYVF